VSEPPIEDPVHGAPIRPREVLRRHPKIAKGFSVAQPFLPREVVHMPDQNQGQQPQQPQGQQAQAQAPQQQQAQAQARQEAQAHQQLDQLANQCAQQIRQQADQQPPRPAAPLDAGTLQHMFSTIGKYAPAVLEFVQRLVAQLGPQAQAQQGGGGGQQPPQPPQG
jgi:hypothetical protein